VIGGIHLTNRELDFELDLFWNQFKKMMMDEDEPAPSFLRQRRSKKNRQTKTQLVFDEQARK
jgi:hypothetical protein